MEVSSDGRRAYLDQTFFYPTSGGQPNDVGLIGSIPVEDVVDEGNRIAHVLASAPHALNLRPGYFECRLDWSRRYDNMQQHTGQHLLSAAFAEIYGFKTASVHMGDDLSSIELACSKLDDAQMDLVERRANDIVSEARPVRISYEDADEVTGLRKDSARTGLLRIVTIDAYDRSACGGTHVRTTAEAGPIQMRGLERVRGNTRVDFVCGGRALRHSKQDFRLLSRLSRAASIPAQELEGHMSGVRGRLEMAEKALAKSKLLLVQTDAGRLYEETPVSADGIRRRSMVTAELSDESRSLAIAFTAHSRAILAILPEAASGPVLLACSADSGLHAGFLWKAAFANGGGKGGGSATLAQGNVTDRESLRKLLSSVNLVDSAENSREQAD